MTSDYSNCCQEKVQLSSLVLMVVAGFLPVFDGYRSSWGWAAVPKAHSMRPVIVVRQLQRGDTGTGRGFFVQK